MPAGCLRHAGVAGDAAASGMRVRCGCTWWTRRRHRRLPPRLLFSYVANYIYDGDAPLAERRAQALSIDQDQLRELLGDADLRELLDADAIDEMEEQLQCADGKPEGARRGRHPRSAAAAGRPDRAELRRRLRCAGCGDPDGTIAACEAPAGGARLRARSG